MKQGISRLTGALNSLTEEIRADEANITELLKDMKNNEKIFQNKVLNEIGKIFFRFAKFTVARKIINW